MRITVDVNSHNKVDLMAALGAITAKLGAAIVGGLTVDGAGDNLPFDGPYYNFRIVKEDMWTGGPVETLTIGAKDG